MVVDDVQVITTARLRPPEDAVLVGDRDFLLDDDRRAVEFFVGKLREAISVPNTGVRKKRRRNTVAGRKGSTYTIYPNPAPKGQPPHLRTGWLRKHVEREYDKDKKIGRTGFWLAQVGGNRALVYTKLRSGSLMS
jgi:hypothetical protein